MHCYSETEGVPFVHVYMYGMMWCGVKQLLMLRISACHLALGEWAMAAADARAAIETDPNYVKGDSAAFDAWLNVIEHGHGIICTGSSRLLPLRHGTGAFVSVGRGKQCCSCRVEDRSRYRPNIFSLSCDFLIALTRILCFQQTSHYQHCNIRFSRNNHVKCHHNSTKTE